MIDGYEMVEPVTGVGRVIEGIVSWLVRILPEHEYIMLTRQPTERFSNRNLSQHTLLPDKGYFRWQNGPFWKKLRQINPDVLIAFNYTLPLFYRRKSILFEHDISFVTHPEWFSYREAVKRKLWVKRSLNRCDVVVTHADFSKKEILKHFSIPPERIQVIYHGVSEMFKKVSPELVEQWKLSKGLQGNRLVGFLGSIFNRRHIPELVAAVRLLRKEDPEIFLYIAGKDMTCPSQDIDRLLDEDWIRWEREVPDDELPVFYSSLDAFAYLSEYEGFGLPPLEALACGTVPVLLNKTSLQEVYADKAIMVESSDVKHISSGLKAALGDVEKRRLLLARFDEQKSVYSWRRAAEEFARILEKVKAA